MTVPLFFPSVPSRDKARQGRKCQQALGRCLNLWILIDRVISLFLSLSVFLSLNLTFPTFLAVFCFFVTLPFFSFTLPCFIYPSAVSDLSQLQYF